MFANYTAYKGHLFLVLILSSLVTNSSDVFTNLFHNFFPRNFSVWQLKNKLFFLSFPDKKEIKLNICLLKKFVDSEFQIGEAIWWIRHINDMSASFSNFAKSVVTCSVYCEKTLLLLLYQQFFATWGQSLFEIAVYLAFIRQVLLVYHKNRWCSFVTSLSFHFYFIKLKLNNNI